MVADRLPAGAWLTDLETCQKDLVLRPLGVWLGSITGWWAQAAQLDIEARDDLHRHLFTVLVDRNAKHGVAAAVDATLLGRYYECFATTPSRSGAASSSRPPEIPNRREIVLDRPITCPWAMIRTCG